MNIYEKMSAAMAEIARVPKNMVVGTGKNQYKAVAEADILKAVKEAESKYKIFSYPLEHTVVESKSLISKNDYGEKESQFVRVKAVYRFVNMEDPKDALEVTAFGDGVDTLDKAPGKATTYADKYALMKAYKVETGDDTDRSASDDLSGHDIWKIKQRIERTVTEKMQAGKTEDQILSAIGLNRKQFDSVMKYFGTISGLEAALKKA